MNKHHSVMTSETHYIITTAYDNGEMETEIIVGENKFREHAIDYYRINNLDERECTSHDIEQFLEHHDVTYFDEKDRPAFEKIISEYKTYPNYSECKISSEDNVFQAIFRLHYIPEIYTPLKTDIDLKVYRIRISDGLMLRYSESRIHTFSKIKTMETSEIIKHMVECGTKTISDQMGWGWCNVMIVTGSNIKVEEG